MIRMDHMGVYSLFYLSKLLLIFNVRKAKDISVINIK